MIASVMKFDEKYGIKIVPSKEASWAAVRDKLVNGELDAAHVLCVDRLHQSGPVDARRRVSRVRAALPPTGEARPDWKIALEFARKLSAFFPGKEKLFPYGTPEEIFNEHRESTRGRDLDITGLPYALLERDAPQQWPYPEGASGGRTRPYVDGVFPTHRTRPLHRH